MTEPDVALTDYGVALECALLAGLLLRGVAGPDMPRGGVPGRGALRRSFAIFFTSAGTAALAGGTVHGFFLNADSVAGAVLWRIALVALGLTAVAAWSIGGRLICTRRTAHLIEALAGGEFVVYAVVVLAVDQSFWIAIANYAPSAVFLGVSFLVLYWKTPSRPTLAGLIGLGLTFVAAIVQRRYHDNVLYHVIQMTAFALIFLAGRRFIANPATAATAAGR